MVSCYLSNHKYLHDAPNISAGRCVDLSASQANAVVPATGYCALPQLANNCNDISSAALVGSVMPLLAATWATDRQHNSTAGAQSIDWHGSHPINCKTTQKVLDRQHWCVPAWAPAPSPAPSDRYAWVCSSQCNLCYMHLIQYAASPHSLHCLAPLHTGGVPPLYTWGVLPPYGGGAYHVT